MTNLREAAQMALDALENPRMAGLRLQAIPALRAALSQPEQEPVAWISAEETWLVPKLVISDTPKDGYKPVYTAPPHRKWQGLTDESVGENND